MRKARPSQSVYYTQITQLRDEDTHMRKYPNQIKVCNTHKLWVFRWGNQGLNPGVPPKAFHCRRLPMYSKRDVLRLQQWWWVLCEGSICRRYGGVKYNVQKVQNILWYKYSINMCQRYMWYNGEPAAGSESSKISIIVIISEERTLR